MFITRSALITDTMHPTLRNTRLPLKEEEDETTRSWKVTNPKGSRRARRTKRSLKHDRLTSTYDFTTLNDEHPALFGTYARHHDALRWRPRMYYISALFNIWPPRFFTMLVRLGSTTERWSTCFEKRTNEVALRTGYGWVQRADLLSMSVSVFHPFTAWYCIRRPWQIKNVRNNSPFPGGFDYGVVYDDI